MSAGDDDNWMGDGATPWPIAGDDLLAEDDDWQYIACVNWDLRTPELGYIEGFRRSARLIVDHVGQTGHDQDRLLFPFALAWRHHVELQLKNLLTSLQQLLDEAQSVPRTHSIERLWKKVRKLLERHAPDESRTDIDNVERVLLQLHRLDPSAEEFRYWSKSDGSPTLTGLDRIHLRRFHEAMERVAHYLDAVDTALRAELDHKAEYLSWLYEEYGEEQGWYS